MPRPAKMWWHAQKKRWACRHEGKLYLFTPEKDESQREFHRLKSIGQQRSTPGEVTVDEVLSLYLDHIESNRSERTYIWTLDNYEQFRKEAFDVSRLASDLTAHDLIAWADKHKEASADGKIKKWSNWTRRQKLTCVQSAFTWAVRTRLIKASPVPWVEKPSKTKREIVVTPDQIGKILETDTDFRDLVVFTKETGCRPQEATMIEAKHFNGKTIYLGIVKKRKRTIYPPAELLPLIKVRCDRYPTGPIFRNTKGKPWTKEAIGIRFRRLRKVMGDNVTLYTLRHTYITEALKAGVPVPVVAQLAGHSPQTTLSVYSHMDHENYSEEMLKASNQISSDAKQKADREASKTSKGSRPKPPRKRQRRTDGT